MHVVVITPITTREFADSIVESLAGAARPDDHLEHILIDQGPASIESEFDEALAIPDTIAKAIEAEKQGASALVINAMIDPAVKPCREAVSIPVLGPLETSCHVAASLGRKFSVVTVLDRIIPIMENRISSYGLASRLASIRAVDIPVLDLDEDKGHLVRDLLEQSQLAVEQEGADVIVLGCTGFSGVAKSIEEGLRGKGYHVPVIDPPVLTIKVAEVLVDMGLSHSKRAYPNAPKKLIVGYNNITSL